MSSKQWVSIRVLWVLICLCWDFWSFFCELKIAFFSWVFRIRWLVILKVFSSHKVMSRYIYYYIISSREAILKEVCNAILVKDDNSYWKAQGRKHAHGVGNNIFCSMKDILLRFVNLHMISASLKFWEQSFRLHSQRNVHHKQEQKNLTEKSKYFQKYR